MRACLCASSHARPRARRPDLLIGLLVPLVSACHLRDRGDDPQPSEDPTIYPLSLPASLVAVPNLDDDDQDGTGDWEQRGATGEDDLQELLVSGGPGELTLTLTGSARIWLDGVVVVDEAAPSATLSTEGERTLGVEMPDFVSEAELSVAWVGSGEAAGQSQQGAVSLRGAPIIFNHHLQGAEAVYAMNGSGNEDFISDFETTLGDAFDSYRMRDYGWDVWIQDEFEIGTATSPGHRLDVVLNSLRSQRGRYLDPLAEDQWSGPNVYIHTWGEGQPTAQDYGGNLEVTPPLTANGVSYPFGRIYYGAWDRSGPNQSVRDLFEAQGVQDPFVLDVQWLCVGHVDEFMTFIPDGTAPRGFRLLFADTRLGHSFLESLDPETSLPRFESGHGYATIGAMLEDADLWAYNDEIQADYLDAYLEALRTEIALTDDEIVALPAAFEQNASCGGYGLALIPGTANLTVAQPDPDGPVHLFMPDPFLRTDPDDQSSDPLIAYINALLPADAEPHWLDDWSNYHMMWGEVHCGSNSRRTPTEDAWTQSVSEEE